MFKKLNIDMQIDLISTKRKHMPSVVKLLQRLSAYVPDSENYDEIWSSFNKQKNVYSVVAKYNNLIIGYGVILIENKIRGGRIGHIEDIVTHKKYTQKGVGQKIINYLSKIAYEKQCYKIVLQCDHSNIKFYKKCSFKSNQFGMSKFFI